MRGEAAGWTMASRIFATPFAPCVARQGSPRRRY